MGSLIRLMVQLIRRPGRWLWTTIVQRTCGSCGKGLWVGFYSRVTRNTHLGDNVNFNGMSVQGDGHVRIGNNFHSGKECVILTDIHNYDSGKSIPYDEVRISKDVIIEDNVWFGYRVLVLGGVAIGEGAIIQAGSVVVSNIPKYSIAGGHPARVFKTRNSVHYERLKSQGMFH